MRNLLVAVVILTALAAGAWFLSAGRPRPRPDVFTGYVVSEDITMTSPIAGTLAQVSVARGQRVAAGQPLFRVDPVVRAAQADQARATIFASEARVGQQQAGAARARADLAAAEAEVDRAAAELRRQQAAQRGLAGAVAAIDIDRARSALESARGRRNAARSELATASAAIAAAKAQVREARAGLTSASHQLADLAPVAPRAGRVEDVMFKRGESVPPNVPVVAIVPDGLVKLRFFVPQARVSAWQPGRRLAVGCDGCAKGMTAVVTFVASEPEYTPPVIYSLDARQKLVFMVEALPADGARLVPGQPIDVAAGTADLPSR